MEKIGETIIEKCQAQAKTAGVENVKAAVLQGDSTDLILKSAKANQVDMIVMGRRGLGEIESLLLGSVSSQVCNQAECTCVTVT